jgi:hypothetical protein
MVATMSAMLILATDYQYYEDDHRLTLIKMKYFLRQALFFFLICENPRPLRAVYGKKGKRGK